MLSARKSSWVISQFSKHPSTFITACITRTYFRLHNIRSDLYLHSKHFCDSICLEDIISKGRLMSDLGLCAALAPATLDTKVIRKMWYKLFVFPFPLSLNSYLNFCGFTPKPDRHNTLHPVGAWIVQTWIPVKARLAWLALHKLDFLAGRSKKKERGLLKKKSCVLPTKYCL